MKTSTLMLLSIACGVAIILAGAVFLFQLSSQDELDGPLAIGATARVGDMDVTVAAVDERDGAATVSVVLSGAVDDDPAADFRMIAAGRAAPFVSTDCEALDGGEATCRITYDTSVADGSSRVLFYERGDERSRWALD